MIDKKVKVLQLIDKIKKDIKMIKNLGKRCEKSFKDLKDVLNDFF
jgi:hypothetical protein